MTLDCLPSYVEANRTRNGQAYMRLCGLMPQSHYPKTPKGHQSSAVCTSKCLTGHLTALKEPSTARGGVRGGSFKCEWRQWTRAQLRTAWSWQLGLLSMHLCVCVDGPGGIDVDGFVLEGCRTSTSNRKKASRSRERVAQDVRLCHMVSPTGRTKLGPRECP